MGKAAAPARNREATRGAILEATSQLIAEKGVDGFSISEVAERGKINRALVYHYFHSRDNLVFETIRFIVQRYESVNQGAGTDSIERSMRMHIEHPEIARFFFHLFLNGQPIPRLSSRLTLTIDALQKLKLANAPDSPFEPALSVLAGWLVQLSWSFARTEIARQLEMDVEEADERMINHLRASSELIRATYADAFRAATR